MKKNSIVRVKRGTHKNYKFSFKEKDPVKLKELEEAGAKYVAFIKSLEGKRFVITNSEKSKELGKVVNYICNNTVREYNKNNLVMFDKDLEILHSNYFNNCCRDVNGNILTLKCEKCGLNIEELID